MPWEAWGPDFTALMDGPVFSTLSDIELSDGDFRRFASLVYESSGINLTEQKKDLLRARLRKRLRALKLNSFKDYFQLVSAKGAEGERKALLDVVSTNKTHFFREARHFDHLREVAVPDWLTSPESQKGPLRIWSAACSSGEEVYTLAMVLQEAFQDRGDFKILGTDISTQMLGRATSGIYEARHVEEVPQKYLGKHFHALETKGERDQVCYGVDSRLASKCAFGRLNLIDQSFPFHSPLDIVFCRNVMIYFDRPTQEALLARIYEVLRPGGWLYTGLSESLLAVRHSFKTVGPSVYRKMA